MREAALRAGTDSYIDFAEARKNPGLIDDSLPGRKADFAIRAHGETGRSQEIAFTLSGQRLEISEAASEDSSPLEKPLDERQVLDLLTYGRISPRSLFTKAVSLKDMAQIIREWETNKELLQVFYRPGLESEFVFEDAQEPFAATVR